MFRFSQTALIAGAVAALLLTVGTRGGATEPKNKPAQSATGHPAMKSAVATTKTSSVSTTTPAAKRAQYFPPSEGQDPWVVSAGANSVTVDTDGLYMRQRKPENTINYAFAALPIEMPGTGAWTVDFDVRFGELGTCPTAVALCSGDNLIGWVGADSFYKSLGSFFGKDFFTDVDRGTFPLADHEWHHFQFLSDGSTIAILRDGKPVGQIASKARPDALEVGQVHLVFGMKPAYLQQTETWVRGIEANYEDSAAPTGKSVPSAPASGANHPRGKSPAAQPASGSSSL